VNAHRVAIDGVYRREYGRILATLIRVADDIAIAEDALADAFQAAVEQWSERAPDNPAGWITQTARHKLVDRLRKRALVEGKRDELERHLTLELGDSEEPVAEDSLRLIFTCCHPALALEAQIALTLRTLCGLATEEIARAFLVPPTTMSQRLVRAKNKIKAARIPYEVPPKAALGERLDAAMRVVYLVFNEGYSASFGDRLTREDLSAEAIRLGRLLVGLMEDEPEPKGLLALMLLHDSRRDARAHEDGSLAVLDEQDRSRWDREQIAEGTALVEAALRIHPVGPYAIQAAIAGVHARAARAEDTHWREIAALYGLLMRSAPSPVVELNRAVAIAMADGLERGLALIDMLSQRGELDGYHLLPAARADLLRRLNRNEQAAHEYGRALELATNDRERGYLERRLREVATKPG
jgi:RNA polymerase sigma-70 factor (ECF subfamily)